jgi:ribosomal protein L35
MPKVKTRKAVTKRVKVKKNKVLAMKSGQNHFNAKQSGSARRAKRKDVVLNVNIKSVQQNINQ